MWQQGRHSVRGLSLLSLPTVPTVPLGTRLQPLGTFTWSPEPGSGSSGRAMLESGVI